MQSRPARELAELGAGGRARRSDSAESSSLATPQRPFLSLARSLSLSVCVLSAAARPPAAALSLLRVSRLSLRLQPSLSHCSAGCHPALPGSEGQKRQGCGRGSLTALWPARASSMHAPGRKRTAARGRAAQLHATLAVFSPSEAGRHVSAVQYMSRYLVIATAPAGALSERLRLEGAAAAGRPAQGRHVHTSAYTDSYPCNSGSRSTGEGRGGCATHKRCRGGGGRATHQHDRLRTPGRETNQDASSVWDGRANGQR